MDFLHPREKPAPVSRRRPLSMAAAGVGSLLLLAVGWAWWTFSSLDAEIERLTKESSTLEPAVKLAGTVEKNVAALDAWTAGDITWLDELSELSRELPPAQEAMLTMLRVAAKDGGGEMQLEGLSQSVAVLAPLEKNLRDDRHSVEGKGVQQDQRRKKYGWRFKATVDIASAAGGAKKPVAAATTKPAATDPSAIADKPATADKPAAQGTPIEPAVKGGK